MRNDTDVLRGENGASFDGGGLGGAKMLKFKRSFLRDQNKMTAHRIRTGANSLGRC